MACLCPQLLSDSGYRLPGGLGSVVNGGGLVRVVAVVVGFVIAVAGLAACSDSDGEPAVIGTAPSESVATPEAEAVLELPVMPELANENSEAGVEAFFEYWIAVFNYAAATGDTAELRRISWEDCEGCNYFIEGIEETYEAGGYFRDGEWIVKDRSISVTGDFHYVDASIVAGEGLSRDSADTEEYLSPGAEMLLVFGLSWLGDWNVEILERRVQ